MARGVGLEGLLLLVLSCPLFTPGGLLPWIKFSHNCNYNSLPGAGRAKGGETATNITFLISIFRFLDPTVSVSFIKCENPHIFREPEVSSQMTSSHYYFSRLITSQGREGDLKIESMLLSKYSLISKERMIVYLNIKARQVLTK